MCLLRARRKRGGNGRGRGSRGSRRRMRKRRAGRTCGGSLARGAAAGAKTGRTDPVRGRLLHRGYVGGVKFGEAAEAVLLATSASSADLASAALATVLERARGEVLMVALRLALVTREAVALRVLLLGPSHHAPALHTVPSRVACRRRGGGVLFLFLVVAINVVLTIVIISVSVCAFSACLSGFASSRSGDSRAARGGRRRRGQHERHHARRG